MITFIFEKGKFAERLDQDTPNFRLLLGEYDVPIPGKVNAVRRMNLYNLPISLEIFHIFIAQKIVGTGRNAYPLLSFIFDLIKFVMDKTQNAFAKQSEFTPESLMPIGFKMDMTSVDLPLNVLESSSGGRDFINLGSDESKGLNTLNLTTIKNTSSCFVLHAKRKLKEGEKSPYRGNIIEDEKRGIFHFFVGGPDRGILKKIDFTQAGNSLFSTALMRNGQEGGNDTHNGVIKPSKFSCDLTLVGNPFFFIGQLIYVNTSLISGGNFEKNGILNGGYYVVVGVENVFTNSRWETKIRAVLNIPDHALPGSKERLVAAMTMVGEKPAGIEEHLRRKAASAEKALQEATTTMGKLNKKVTKRVD